MPKELSKRLSRHRPATYQIKVPGVIDVSRADWAREMPITVEREDEGLSITTLTGDCGQAALHGLLRRLYTLGLALISII